MPQGLLAVIGLVLRHRNRLFPVNHKNGDRLQTRNRRKQNMKTVIGISLEKREIPRSF